MLSVSGKDWVETSINNRIIEKVNNDNNFTSLISKLVISRNYSQIEIDSINNEIFLSNPFDKIEDINRGHKILNKTIYSNKKVLVIGDYDVDGCVATSLFVNFFKILKKDIDYYIPNRFTDGYGAKLELIKKLVKKKPDLIIMVDCGSNAGDSIDYLNSLNIETIIIDHHEIYEPYPKSKCLINPKKKCEYRYLDYLCSSTLVYFFIESFLDNKILKKRFSENLIYVLLASICDVMPLRNINRLIAIHVFKEKQIEKNFIFKKIIQLKNIKKKIEIEDFAFLFGPIINSAGRLSDANYVVKLLSSSNLHDMEKIIKHLISVNEKRKKIEKNYFDKLDIKGFKKKKNNVLVEYKHILNEGIIGIIASKLTDYFNKPAVVLTMANEYYKGSARSTPNFNIGKYIKEAIEKKIILSGGGHNLAAGFSIEKNKINEFENFINKSYLKNNSNSSKKFISKISLDAVNKSFFDIFNKLKPFGVNNDYPIFFMDKVRIYKPKILKNKFISFYVKSGNKKLIPGISFTFVESEITHNLLYNKNEMSLIIQIKENNWNNKKNLQLIVLDVITKPNKA